MTCRTLINFLMEYLSGELPLSQREEFDAHLAECLECVAYVKTYNKTVTLGKAAFEDQGAAVPADVPEDLVTAILAARRA